MTNHTTSFYIPRMRVNWTTEQIKQTIEQLLRIGTIDRIDFGEFIPVGQTDTRSVFLHMAFVESIWADWLKHNIDATGHARLQITQNEFWMLIPNRNPLPTTHLNIHQLAEITRNQTQRIVVLEATIEDFSAKAAAQEATIATLVSRLNAIAPVLQLTNPVQSDIHPQLLPTLLASIAIEATPEETPINQNIILPPIVNSQGPSFLNIDGLHVNPTNASCFIDNVRDVNTTGLSTPVEANLISNIDMVSRIEMSAHFCGNY